jgi:hypothetical protein
MATTGITGNIRVGRGANIMAGRKARTTNPRFGLAVCPTVTRWTRQSQC